MFFGAAVPPNGLPHSSSHYGRSPRRWHQARNKPWSDSLLIPRYLVKGLGKWSNNVCRNLEGENCHSKFKWQMIHLWHRMMRSDFLQKPDEKKKIAKLHLKEFLQIWFYLNITKLFSALKDLRSSQPWSWRVLPRLMPAAQGTRPAPQNLWRIPVRPSWPRSAVLGDPKTAASCSQLQPVAAKLGAERLQDVLPQTTLEASPCPIWSSWFHSCSWQGKLDAWMLTTGSWSKNPQRVVVQKSSTASGLSYRKTNDINERMIASKPAWLTSAEKITSFRRYS